MYSTMYSGQETNKADRTSQKQLTQKEKVSNCLADVSGAFRKTLIDIWSGGDLLLMLVATYEPRANPSSYCWLMRHHLDWSVFVSEMNTGPDQRPLT